MAGRRECESGSVTVFAPVRADVEGREKSVRSSMKLPAARLAGVRGSSSFTLTSYGCNDTTSEPMEAIPHGWPSLLESKGNEG